MSTRLARRLADWLGGLLIAAALLALGLFTTWLAGGRFTAGVGAWGWVETPCTIMDAYMDAEGKAVEVSYVYEWEGREYEGSRYAYESPFVTDDHDVWGALQEVIPGTHRTCFVDSDDPGRSVLIRDRWWVQVITGTGALFGLTLLLSAVWLLRIVVADRDAPDPIRV